MRRSKKLGYLLFGHRTVRSQNETSMMLALATVLMVLAVIFIYPMIFVLINSIRSTEEIVLDPAGWPVKLYLEEMQFHRVFLNTLVITVLSTVGIIITSAMCAYALARSNSKISWALYIFFAFYLVIPFQIIMVPIGVLASDLHLMNIPGIIVMYWGLGCPTAIFMFHGFIKSVPRELEESAAIDGAGRFYIFFIIVLPLIKTIVATIAVIDALWIWNDFLLPMIVIKKGTIQLAQQAFKGLSVNKYGPMCASLAISSIPIIAFYLALQKHIIKGIAAGAVKG